jgi:hypothetical protein
MRSVEKERCVCLVHHLCCLFCCLCVCFFRVVFCEKKLNVLGERWGKAKEGRSNLTTSNSRRKRMEEGRFGFSHVFLFFFFCSDSLKVDERRERQRMRKEERLAQWHDPKWKTEFLRFEAQLRVLGLRIVDMTGDGNCLFRSVCDQMEGSADNHVKVRRECVAFLRKFSDNFAPFLDTEEQSFDDYCKDMAQVLVVC